MSAVIVPASALTASNALAYIKTHVTGHLKTSDGVVGVSVRQVLKARRKRVPGNLGGGELPAARRSGAAGRPMRSRGVGQSRTPAKTIAERITDLNDAREQLLYFALLPDVPHVCPFSSASASIFTSSTSPTYHPSQCPLPPSTPPQRTTPSSSRRTQITTSSPSRSLALNVRASQVSAPWALVCVEGALD